MQGQSISVTTPVLTAFDHLKIRIEEHLTLHLFEKFWRIPLLGSNPETNQTIIQFLINNGFEANIEGYHDYGPHLCWLVTDSTERILSDLNLKRIMQDRCTAIFSEFEELKTHVLEVMNTHLVQNKWLLSLDSYSEINREAINKYLRRNGFKANIEGYRDNILSIHWELTTYTDKKAFEPCITEILQRRNASIGAEFAHLKNRIIEKMHKDLIRGVWYISLENCSEINLDAAKKWLKSNGLEVTFERYHPHALSLHWKLIATTEKQVFDASLDEIIKTRSRVLEEEFAAIKTTIVTCVTQDVQQTAWKIDVAQYSVKTCRKIEKKLIKNGIEVKNLHSSQDTASLIFSLTTQTPHQVVDSFLKNALNEREANQIASVSIMGAAMTRGGVPTIIDTGFSEVEGIQVLEAAHLKYKLNVQTNFFSAIKIEKFQQAHPQATNDDVVVEFVDDLQQSGQNQGLTF